MTIFDLLQLVVDQQASDLHIIVGTRPTIRVHGKLLVVDESPVLADRDTHMLIDPLLNDEQKKLYEVNKEIDFSYQYKDLGRFRVNAYTQKGSSAAALRLIPNVIKGIDELQLPQVYHDICKLKQGLILVTGPTGEGKSTSLAAIIQEINHTRAEHIVTIEDPIEFAYTPEKSLISQREVHNDTHGWDVALRSVLREDPDVVLVGEMRDFETIAAALTTAETGHLVLATLHTNSASQTIDRIIDVFPEHQQGQVRQQLASSLEAVFSQRLVPTKEGTLICAVEVLLVNSAVRNLIREGKAFQIDNVMQTSGEVGMTTMESSLARWVSTGIISKETAREHSTRPAEFDRLVRG